MNKILGFGLVMILLLGGVSYYAWQSTRVPVAEQVAVTPELPSLSPEVETVLADKMKVALELTINPIIQKAITDATTENIKLTKEQIAELDLKWRNSKGTGEFVDKFLNNTGASALKAFQADHPEFKEIFVTDIHGLNVSQTNKTSDYLQSDEEWWMDSYKDGNGNAHHGAIEFDESSQTEAIAIYIPMRDTSGKVIGIMKAILDLAIIKASI